jgi:hypothetical protein
MAMVKRIACFLTCGYTEAGTMQAFLRKINSNFEYRQYLPNRTIKKKGDPKNIDSSISGLTGDALLKRIYEIVEKHNKEISECAGIIIEDDLDARFEGWSDTEIHEYNQNIKDTVCQKLGCYIPVFILYASPEIESWFVADWENGFKYLYCNSGCIDDIDTNARKFFAHHLKQYVEYFILKEYHDDIEKYGFFDGKYIKLSEQLIQAIQYDVKEYIKNLSGTNSEYMKQIDNSRCLYYSKKLHGNIMLRNISSENVSNLCVNYFKITYYELKEFTSEGAPHGKRNKN